MKAFAKKFYNSSAWVKCRNAYISGRTAVDGGMCELCQRELGVIVHHKITLTPENIIFPEVALNHENLQYVCQTCHNKIDHFGTRSEADRERCGFDADGQPFMLP